MDHVTMFDFKKYLLETGGDEERRSQSNKRFCDGSMQKYLQKRWDELHQDSNVQITGAWSEPQYSDRISHDFTETSRVNT